jgi:hypothetical protein
MRERGCCFARDSRAERAYWRFSLAPVNVSQWRLMIRVCGSFSLVQSLRTPKLPPLTAL